MSMTRETREEKADYETAAETAQSARKRHNQRKEPKKPKKISERYLHNAGLAYLQRFSSSSANFRKIMLRKIDKSCQFHTEQDKENCTALLDQLILKFQDLGLLDDETYLRGMVTTLRRRGLSSRQIQQKLIQKGLSASDIKNALSCFEKEEYDTHDQGDLYAAIIFMRKKKIGPFDFMNQKDPEKALASMARAGYSYEIASKSLKMSMEELEQDFRFLL